MSKIRKLEDYCDQCRKIISLKDKLSKHIESVHENNNYTCDECDFKVTQRGKFKKHLESKHNICDKCRKDIIKKENIIREKIQDIEDKLSEKLAIENVKNIKDQVENMCNIDGEFSHINTWEIKKKILRRKNDPPMGKKDANGNLVTNYEGLKDLYLSHFENILKNREINEELKSLKEMKETLWEERLKGLSKMVTPDWTMKQLEKVLKSLKNNKSRDPEGLIAEIFKEEVAGSDLKRSLLLFLNKVKKNQDYPEFMLYADIVSLYKNTGEKMTCKMTEAYLF